MNPFISASSQLQYVVIAYSCALFYFYPSPFAGHGQTLEEDAYVP